MGMFLRWDVVTSDFINVNESEVLQVRIQSPVISFYTNSFNIKKRQSIYV